MEHIHQYNAIKDTPEAIVEVCSTCKHKLTTKKGSNGRIDTKKWLKDHVGDTAQPTGSTAKVFKKLYGEPKV
jgi:hypothetical protein